MLQLYLVLFSLNLVSSGLLFFIEDFRCAETIPGTILVEFVFFGHVLFLSRSSGVLQLYLVLFWLNLGFSGLCYFLSRSSCMLQLYLVLLDETTGILASTLFHSCAD